MTMDKKFICAAVCVFLVLLIGGSIMFLFKSSPKSGLLKMNGVVIARENVTIYSDYTELPLIEVMKSLDMDVNWLDKNTAVIMYDGKKYTLNLINVTLFEDGQDRNLLLPPPGGKRHYTVLEEELVLDSNTVKSVMYLMGIHLRIDIDRKEQIVSISKIGDGFA